MKVQQKGEGALFIYISKADAEELGWKKGDTLKTCVMDDILRVQKRGIKK